MPMPGAAEATLVSQSRGVEPGKRRCWCECGAWNTTKFGLRYISDLWQSIREVTETFANYAHDLQAIYVDFQRRQR